MHRRARQRLVLLAAGILLLSGNGIGQAANRPTGTTAASDARADQRATELNNSGVLEAKAGRFEAGIALLRQALEQSPTDPTTRKNLSAVLTDWAAQLQEQGRVDPALSALQEAHELDPDNLAALLRLGDLYYATHSELSSAIHAWKRAYPRLQSQQRRAVLERISQAERDMAIEWKYIQKETPHFLLRFEEPGHEQLAENVGLALEQAYEQLTQLMGAAPARLTVILYTEGSFQRVAGRRDWAVGLYDGRIRLRLDEIGTQWTPHLIMHELTHAFLAEIYGVGIPTWIHEGFAQLQEPPAALSGRQEQLRRELQAGTSWIPLKWLDQRFVRPSQPTDIERCYAESAIAVESLVTRHGMPRFLTFLQRLSSGTPIAHAFDETFAPSQWARFNQGHLE